MPLCKVPASFWSCVKVSLLPHRDRIKAAAAAAHSRLPTRSGSSLVEIVVMVVQLYFCPLHLMTSHFKASDVTVHLFWWRSKYGSSRWWIVSSGILGLILKNMLVSLNRASSFIPNTTKVGRYYICFLCYLVPNRVLDKAIDSVLDYWHYSSLFLFIRQYLIWAT